MVVVVEGPDVVASGQAVTEDLDLFSSREVRPGFLRFIRAFVLLGSFCQDLGLLGLELLLFLFLLGYSLQQPPYVSLVK